MRVIEILLAAITVAGSPARATDAAPPYDPRAAFAEADTNHDGAVDRAEFHDRMVEVFYHADANRDGFLDGVELKQLAFPEGLIDYDTDRDGRVSLREFLRVRFIDFPRTDTNDDGVLSLHEVVAAYDGRKRR